MKVRIVQPGYEKLTGEMGHIQFVDGVSVNSLNPDFVRSLSGIVKVEPVEEAPSEPEQPEDPQDPEDE